MSSLLAQCLQGTGASGSRNYAIAFFHSSASVTKGARGARDSDDTRSSTSKAARRVSTFTRDGLPHVGKAPREDRLPRRELRERDTPPKDTRPKDTGARKSSPSHPNSRSPLASPRAVDSSKTNGRRDRPRDGFRSNEAAGTERRFAKGKSEKEFFTTYPRLRAAMAGGYSDTKDVRPSFSRLPDGTYRLRETRPHSKLAPSSDSDVDRSPPSSSSRPTAFVDAAESRQFSDFDKPIRAGAYDEPQLQDEFYHPPEPVTSLSSAKGKHKSDTTVPASFSSPPLLPGFVSSLKEMLGADAVPTPIQSLSLKHLFDESSAPVTGAPGWRQFLLASETGSGKSIAYLLPLLQHVKQAEASAQTDAAPPQAPSRLLNPRGLVLAPTHELARQLTVFAKSLLHEVKLRVLCASQANTRSSPKQPESNTRASQMSAMAQAFNATEDGSETDALKAGGAHPVGVVVGTPMKLLEMVRGRGWDGVEESDESKEEEQLEAQEEDVEGKTKKVRRGRDKVVHFGKWKTKPELGLANVEWVVVDEADVLFDPDFQETTRTLLADISAARGHVLPPSALAAPVPLPNPNSVDPATLPPASEPINYPFNLILTSATIPKSLNVYLALHHPALVRLASPRLHRLPKTLQTEYVGWTGGNKFADVMRRLRRIWAEDAASASADGLSKVLVFCNKSAKVVEFSAYLAENGIKSVAMTSQSELRGRGSNRHLAGFLRKLGEAETSSSSSSSSKMSVVPQNPQDTDVSAEAHVMVTTSLLSRGLDFAPDIRHVFIVDEPRNTIDFLHRAGRTGRAGQRGKVVIFGKMEGRGSQRTKDTRKRIGALSAA